MLPAVPREEAPVSQAQGWGVQRQATNLAPTSNGCRKPALQGSPPPMLGPFKASEGRAEGAGGGRSGQGAKDPLPMASPTLFAPSKRGGAELNKQGLSVGKAGQPRQRARGRLLATMELLRLALLLGCLCGSFAAEESCQGRCDKGFDRLKKCQCDELCMYYQSCCLDYASTCKVKVTRGDVFMQPEDDYQDYYDLPYTTAPVPTLSPPQTPGTPVEEQPTTDYEEEKWWVGPTEGGLWDPTETVALPGGEEAEETLCSGQPFDAFTSLKNGSIFAFRGKYLYELDEKSARPGYPKLIRDVWGIDGPIDAAFSRVNCQGKTYLFQGSRYWRFHEGRLEADYPRNISEGFDGIPDHLDAALALPARDFLASERVYFFKGSRYWSYDFAQQPSRAECEQTRPSLVFGHYAGLQQDSWEEAFRLLFGGGRPGEASPARSTRRDWRGLPSRLDAAMLGRIYVAQSPSGTSGRRRASRRRHRKKYHRRQRWGRWDASAFWEPLGGISSESSDGDWLLSPCQPSQSAYFFVDDKYYRVNLHTRRVDWVYPRYPRPIAKYWLGCPSKELL